ncbi:MAG: radical SAM protein [Candidatus Omnitrophota bacterium]
MSREDPQLLFAGTNGKIFSLPSIEAAGMKGSHFFRLSAERLVKVPHGSELFVLPGRAPVGYDRELGKFVRIDRDPYSKKREPCFAIAAFVSPGYTVTASSAYREIGRPKMLPLFSYAAVALWRGEFYVASVRVDRERRQDLRCVDMNAVAASAGSSRKLFPGNRLIRHLAGCALSYGCPAAKNFFLKKYEAPLPTSPSCNAFCAGCISYQPRKRCQVTQPRITFIPSPEEVSEIALSHIKYTRDPVVSFGQGCEGEPLLVGDVLAKSIALIRKKTSKGVINVNTNASKPDVIEKLCDEGLDSIRVSLNSAQADFYTRYYRPKGYAFKDVISSIRIAKKKGIFVSINYLTMPGFTDTKSELSAFRKLIGKYRIDMVQWRNMNYDPVRYFQDLNIRCDPREMAGVNEAIRSLREEFPGLMMGYFNPSRGRIARYRLRMGLCRRTRAA